MQALHMAMLAWICLGHLFPCSSSCCVSAVRALCLFWMAQQRRSFSWCLQARSRQIASDAFWLSIRAQPVSLGMSSTCALSSFVGSRLFAKRCIGRGADARFCKLNELCMIFKRTTCILELEVVTGSSRSCAGSVMGMGPRLWSKFGCP